MEVPLTQNILLVDDRPENLMALESILEGPGRDFIKAESGEEALRLLLKNDISLILLDVQMPGIDGFETASLIRGTQRTKNIPIIFVTAISKEQKHIFKGYESGAVDYMFKPLEPAIVQSKVDIFLELDRQRRLLEVQNQELVYAKKNTDNIFANIEEGLFLLDKNHNIKPNYSKALELILGRDDLANRNLLESLENAISESEFDSTRDYLDLMFNENLDDRSFSELNPLLNIKYQSNGKTKDPKFLKFTFKRVYNNDQIAELIATVTDRTERTVLGVKLADKEVESKKRLELLNILQIEPQLLKEFMIQTDKEIHSIISELVDISNSDKKEYIYRVVHSIKGNASLLGLQFFADQAHKFEEKLSTMHQDKSVLKFDQDFLHQILDEMLRTLTDFRELIDDMRRFYEHYDTRSQNAGDLIIRAISNLVNKLNNELHKNVEFNYSEFDQTIIPANDILLLKDIFVQLTRNSIFHGIENANDRKKKKKKSTSNIILSSNQKNGSLIINFSDDGRGIDKEKLQKIALDSGKWTKADIDRWQDDQIANLIFIPGITTSKKAGMFAGRGMGMSIIREKLDALKGNIKIKFESGKFCQFIITLPLQ